MAQITTKILLLFMSNLITVETGTLQNVYITDNKVAIKGTDIRLACRISDFSDRDVVFLYKTDSKTPSGSLPSSSLDQCLPSYCLSGKTDKYNFSADNSNVYIKIPNLSRPNDQKWWTFALNNQRKDLHLEVITVPQKLELHSTPSQDQDLSENNVTLRCNTGCVYPKPSFKWYYNGSGSPIQEWSSSGSATDTAGTCTDFERIYSSTLSFVRYTQFPGNLDKTVKFICGIPSFTGMTKPLFTNSSVSLQFTVQVKNVTLIYGNSEAPPTVQVARNTSIPFSCTTSVSRPTATIVWYIGTEEKQRSSSSSIFIFTPQNSDHDKQIFCKAFNIQQENKAVSSNKAKLYVQDTYVQSFYIKEHPGQDNVTVDEHDAQLEFKCDVYSNTASKTKITFKGNLIKERINVTSMSVSRQYVSCYDAGVYTCEGINDNGKISSKKIFLSVRCVPRPRDQVQRNVSSELYSSITISFTAIAYPEPNPKGFAWHKDEDVGWVLLLSNNHQKISSSGLQSNLTVLNVSKEDYGNYRVTVTNDIGTYVQLFFLSGKMNQMSSQCNCQQSEQTALVVGIPLGVVCCVLASVAFYLNMLRMRAYAKDDRSLSRPKKRSTYINPSFGSDVVERQEYENVATDQGGSPNQQQYTDLSRYANTDKDTYDVIKKI